MKEQLLYLGMSTSSYTKKTGTTTSYTWGSTSKWKTFKTPSAKKYQVKYDAKKHNAWQGASGWSNGGVTKYGVAIPSKANRTINGKTVSCNVRYRVRGLTKYERPSSLKKQKKMYKHIYTTASNPYQYQLQYADTPVYSNVYTSYDNGYIYTYFSSQYKNASGTMVNSPGKLMHPQAFTVTMSDYRKNTTSNSEERTSSGVYVMANARIGIYTIKMEWNGVPESEGHDIISILTPRGAKKWVKCQFRQPSNGDPITKTFYPSDREVEYYPDGSFKKISVTLTEV